MNYRGFAGTALPTVLHPEVPRKFYEKTPIPFWLYMQKTSAAVSGEICPVGLNQKHQQFPCRLLAGRQAKTMPVPHKPALQNNPLCRPNRSRGWLAVIPPIINLLSKTIYTLLPEPLIRRTFDGKDLHWHTTTLDPMRSAGNAEGAARFP